MDTTTVKYPLGVQTFSDLIEEGNLYIDKTEYVYRMTHSNSKYIFLSRPRRFGKSLLTSTLRSYFEGRKDLFKGLAIEKLEKEWEQYPVIHISFASLKYSGKDRLERDINIKLLDYEKIYGAVEGDSPKQRLEAIVKNAYEKTGQKVVLLIDEYDAPLLEVMHEDDELPAIRKIMGDFYSPIKDLDPYLRFVFLTGIAKFSQLSIFSELNNILNISMMPEYAAVCGITHEEMLNNMETGINELAKYNKLTYEQAVNKLKDNYDGYHFSWPSPDIYNPFSLLNTLSARTFRSYWFVNTPNYLVEMLRLYNMSPSEFGQPMEAIPEDFDAPTEKLTNIIPLLYQSGYITIKDYDELSEMYTLGIPNREIRIGMMRGLLPNYVSQRKVLFSPTQSQMQLALLRDDIDGVFTSLKTFLGTVPYVDNPDGTKFHESHWQQMLFIIFSMLGARCDVEVHTSLGRVDLVARSATTLYLIEIKINKSAQAAMDQINLKQYDKRFALSNLPVVKVGVNFDLTQKNITDWKVER